MEQQQPQSAAAAVPKKDAIGRSYAFGVILALAVTVSFVAGIFVGNVRGSQANTNDPIVEGKVSGMYTDAPSSVSKDVDFDAFWDIWKTVKARHVGSEPASDIKMFYGAVAGMVASVGDPYTVFFDPEYAEQFAKELGGEFEGIGAEIGIKQNQLTVIAPLPDSPAEKAGIFAGDRILGIDDFDTTGMTADEAVRRIRGDKGTVVKLHIMREGMKEPKEISITRAKIVVQSVKSKVVQREGKYFAHITIAHFNDKTVPQFMEAARAATAQDVDGIILDLRNNPGGYLDAAVDVAGEWVGNGLVVTEKSGDEEDKPLNASGTGRLGDIPTVVLMNGGSASASEIVAGALHDHNKAKLVGEKSFGKGSVQDYQTYNDGSALKITVALWYTPNDVNINKEGIKPDFNVENTPEDFNMDRDPQLDAGIEVLLGRTPKTTPVEEEKPAPTVEP